MAADQELNFRVSLQILLPAIWSVVQGLELVCLWDCWLSSCVHSGQGNLRGRTSIGASFFFWTSLLEDGVMTWRTPESPCFGKLHCLVSAEKCLLTVWNTSRSVEDVLPDWTSESLGKCSVSTLLETWCFKSTRCAHP